MICKLLLRTILIQNVKFGLSFIYFPIFEFFDISKVTTKTEPQEVSDYFLPLYVIFPSLTLTALSHLEFSNFELLRVQNNHF